MILTLKINLGDLKNAQIKKRNSRRFEIMKALSYSTYSKLSHDFDDGLLTILNFKKEEQKQYNVYGSFYHWLFLEVENYWIETAIEHNVYNFVVEKYCENKGIDELEFYKYQKKENGLKNLKQIELMFKIAFEFKKNYKFDQIEKEFKNEKYKGRYDAIDASAVYDLKFVQTDFILDIFEKYNYDIQSYIYHKKSKKEMHYIFINKNDGNIEEIVINNNVLESGFEKIKKVDHALQTFATYESQQRNFARNYNLDENEFVKRFYEKFIGEKNEKSY